MCNHPLVTIILNNCNLKEIPTDSEKGGILLFTSSDISYKVLKDFKIHEAKKTVNNTISLSRMFNYATLRNVA